MKASVIIPAHNGARFLARCLAALTAQTGAAFDVIVVDNGSSDGGADLVAAEFPEVRLVREPRALGFSGACNHGLRLALAGDAEALLILNQDTEVHPGWLAALLAALEAEPRVGIAGCKALFPNGRIQHAGGELLPPLGYGRNIGYNQPADAPLPATPLDFLSGVALAMRRSTLEQIGLFDEGFNPAYFEDVDLCLRAVAAGWELRYVAEASLTHREGAANAGADHRHVALIERNRLRLQLKHAPIARLVGELFPAEAAQLRERARTGTAQSLRRAYLEAMLMLPALGRPREESATIRKALGELRRQGAGVSSQGAGVRGQESGVSSQESGVRGQFTGARSQFTGVSSQESVHRGQFTGPS